MIARRSISWRLTVWFSSVLFVGLILFGAAMWLDLDRTLVTGRSRTLERRADRLAELLRSIDSDPPAERARKFQAFAEATGGGLIRVLHIDGSPALPSSPAAAAFPWPKLETAARERIQQADDSGQPYLVLTRRFSSVGEPLLLSVAASLEGNRPILHAFSIGLLAMAPALLILSAWGGYLLSRRALKPVDQIVAATRSIGLSSLSERLPVPQTRDELQRLSETQNEMLARLETAVGEIKRFTADASHELRHPLSFVRTVAELALRNPPADASSRTAFAEIVEECGKAQRLLEDMLTLARADAGNARLAFEPVDAAEVVQSVCEKARVMPAAHGHSIVVSVEGDAPFTVLADYSSLRRLVWILVENAAKYTPVPGQIEVAVADVSDGIAITVKDNGIGVSETDLPHIFERFYRADPSRSRVEGSGLGLAIGKWIADVHRARISVESAQAAGRVVKGMRSSQDLAAPGESVVRDSFQSPQAPGESVVRESLKSDRKGSVFQVVFPRFAESPHGGNESVRREYEFTPKTA
jgi:signal transduction histidine kinase